MQSVVDASGNSLGLPAGTTNYQYDGNGNVWNAHNAANTAGNRNVTYNLLNLPLVVTNLNGTITYTYDAAGNKLRKVSVQSGVTTNTDYIGGIQYTGTTSENIQYIMTEEGQAAPNGTTNYDYQYFLGDNLGNTRLSFGTKTGATVKYQKDDYYPFGMEISDTVSNPKNYYLYNKKELQSEFGEYDYGARFYDPVIARWTTVDPKAELDRRWSAYVYGLDNAIRFEDPDGMEACDPCDVPDGDCGNCNMTRSVGGHVVSTESFNSPAPIPGLTGEDVDKVSNAYTIIGGGISALGYAGSVFGPEVPAVLVPIGTGISSLGAGISVAHDLSNGNVGSAVTTAVLDQGFGAMKSVIEDSKAITTTGKIILGATNLAASTVAGKIADKIKTDHQQPQVKIEPQKKTKDDPKKDKFVQDWFKSKEKKK